MLGSIRALLGLAIVHQAVALSSHSPRDLEALPAYSVVLAENGILNETVADFLSETPEPSSDKYPLRRHLLRTPSGQAFLCTVPAASDETKKQADARADQDALVRAKERERGVQHGLALLEPMRQGCLYLRQGWFTYSFCYGSQVRQFHAYDMRVPGSAGPKEDPDAEAYTLGMMPEPSFVATPKYGSGKLAAAQQVPTTLGGGDGLGWDEGGRYLSQVWDSGTICDKTGLPREVEVQFHCNTQTIDRIAHIRETSICRYVMLIHTPRLCGEPLFLEGHDQSQEPAATIECQPVVRRLQEQLSGNPAAEAHVSEADGQVSYEEAVTEPADALAQQDQVAEAQAGDVNEVHSVLDELLDHEGTLTLVYDAETGEVESLITGFGEDVFVDSELKKQLFGEVVQAAIGARDSTSSDQAPTESADHEVPTEGSSDDDGEQHERKNPTVQSLEGLAKLMHDTLAEALREHAHGGGDSQPQTASTDHVAPPAADSNPVETLIEAIRRATSGGQPAQGRQKPMHPGLHKYLQGFEKEKRAVQVPPETVLGSEAHERLKQQFARRYEADDVHEQDKDRKETPRRPDGAPPRDEL